MADLIPWLVAGIPQYAVVAAMVLLAALLGFLGRNHRASRIFAIYLFVRAASMLAATARELHIYGTGDAWHAAYWAGVFPYLAIPLPFLLLLLMWSYPTRSGPMRIDRRWTVATTTAAVILLELLYFVRHDAFTTATSTSGGATAYLPGGPLGAVVGLRVLVAGALSWHLARAAGRRSGHDQAGLLLMSLGFLVGTLFECVGLAAYLPFSDDPASLADALILLAIIPSVLAVRAVALATRGHRALWAARRYLLVAAVTLASMVFFSIFQYLDASNRLDQLDTLGAALFGVLRWVLPVTVTYALLRHHLFGIDLALRFTIRQSTIAGTFVAVFFAVSEGAAAFFTETSNSTLIGIMGAAILVFAMAPLQRVAERISRSALPETQPTPAYVQYRKLQVYRAALEGVLEDGRVTPRESSVLTRLRRELGIADGDAKALEKDICEAMAG